MGDLIYFVLERVKDGSILLTAKYDPTQNHLAINPQHLQSPEAPQALEFLRHALDKKALSALADRQEDMIEFYVMQLFHMGDISPGELKESLAQLEDLVESSALASETWMQYDLMQKMLQMETHLHNVFEADNIIEFPGNTSTKRKPVSTNQKSKKGQAAIQGAGDTLTLRVDLKGAQPKIWRRLQIPANLSLSQLHEVLQIAMGWDNAHLWQFIDRNRNFYMEGDDGFGIESYNPEEFTVGDFLQQAGDHFSYEYDFGDSWEHRLQLEKREHKPAALQIVKAVNACPPEDCGGIWGYAEILHMLKKKRKNAQDREILEWLGHDFEPDYFDLETANQRLKQLKL